MEGKGITSHGLLKDHPTRTSRTLAVYGLLLGVWCIIGIWEIIEHGRVKGSARNALVNRARDISNTLAIVIRSQRYFIPLPRLGAVFRHCGSASRPSAPPPIRPLLGGRSFGDHPTVRSAQQGGHWPLWRHPV